MRNVVILGGGYGGIQVLNGLLARTLPDDVQLIVVDKNPYHSLKTEFFTIAAGTAAERDVRMDFPNSDRVQYVFATVEKIDTETRELMFSDRTENVSYDYLIIGLGCEDNYHGVEGAPEYVESVQSFSKARHTGMSVGNLKAYGKVTVVGAGLSGIEVASEIRESRSDLNIRLLDRGASVLRAFDPRIQAHVADWFLKNDVDVLHHANVEYVEKDGVCNNGVCYVNDVTIWTAGVQPHHLVRALSYDKDKQEKIKLNEFYQVPADPSVYVVGDCASSEFSPSGQLAGAQGEAISDVLHAVLHGKAPRVPKPPKLKGTLGSLGSSDGFGNMFQQPFTGWLPRVAKSGVLWLHKRH
ncbi:NAD(P)/FAD-dependent oxidoreductase [Lentibacillus saliphilus]|uniref:NAD(P)/FAD-dependent oxidoreductase n=1 Tax=Lentibacillus saliphilus TaxID=2737028 RepID=UPI001C30D709|nr:FAD-dependent oxidoreductase [Lentibacillus saliphilus]